MIISTTTARRDGAMMSEAQRVLVRLVVVTTVREVGDVRDAQWAGASTIASHDAAMIASEDEGVGLLPRPTRGTTALVEHALMQCAA